MNASDTTGWQDHAQPRVRVAVLEARTNPDTPEALGCGLRALQPDFCLVHNVAISFAEAWLAALASAAGCHLVSGANLILGQGVSTLALLTRCAPRVTRLVDLNIPPAPPNGAMDLDFDADGASLRIVAVALSRNSEEHAPQADALRALLLRRHVPALVLGRFDMADLDLAPEPKGVTGTIASWPARLGFGGRPSQRLRIASFPASPLDAVQMAPTTAAMIAFEVNMPILTDSDSASDSDPVLQAIGPTT